MSGKMIRNTGIAFASTLALALSACGSSPQNEALRNGTAGEEVNSICFSRNIDSWREHSATSVILRANIDEYYLVDLVGACQPSEAFATISVESRTGVCLSPGDRIGFDNDRAPACSISEIHRWIPAPIEEVE
ncbi:MAG: hypothetical protein CMQ46_11850 [Gammaproteobacteria bacterium]|nr:hypothetical protein [Gammaproteobacteria bacterium]MBJ55940.1 hypothetical protein [Gammaproteobacteria bacterium]|tara:strand:- start:1495 stop:1893 length:399 start_codon:yes stop_codon:yes gene_type:complete